MGTAEQKSPTTLTKSDEGDWSVYSISPHSTQEGFYRSAKIIILHNGPVISYLNLTMSINFSPIDFYVTLVSSLELAMHEGVENERIVVPNRRIWSAGTVANIQFPNGVYALDEKELYGITKIANLPKVPGDYANNLYQLSRSAREKNLDFLTSTHVVLEEGFVALQSNIHFPLAVAPAILKGLDNPDIRRGLPITLIQEILDQEIRNSKKNKNLTMLERN